MLFHEQGWVTRLFLKSIFIKTKFYHTQSLKSMTGDPLFISLFSLIQFLLWLNSSPLLVFLTNFPLVLPLLLGSSFPIFSHVSGGSSQILSRFLLHPLQSVITMKVDMGIGLPSNCTCSSCFRDIVFFAVSFHLSLILQPASFLCFSFYFFSLSSNCLCVLLQAPQECPILSGPPLPFPFPLVVLLLSPA